MARARTTLVVLTAFATLAASMWPPPVAAAPPLVSPSGAGTVVIGPQSMEGNLQIHPGDPLRAGFDFTMPGSHPTATATIYNASVSLLVKCADGSTPALAINLPAQTITDPAGSPSWYPSGDQSSSLVFQGALTAPDLCGGGIMNDASGAVFTATFFSTDTIDKVNFRFHYSDNTSGSWSATLTGIPTPFAKTVTSASLTPALSLGLSSDHATAIPGDTITYTATVTNTGSILKFAGDFVASDTGTATAIVASYWDVVSTSLDGATWTPLAGAAGTNVGYTPAVPAPTSTGMTLSATSVPATGVTYPTMGDPILTTSIGGGNTAAWHYAAIVFLSSTQAATLVDPTKVKKVRNSFHLEVSPANPNVTQPAVVNVDFSGLFFGAGPSASVSNVTVTIQPPQGAAPLVFNSGSTLGLATLGPGASVSVSGTFMVPVVPAKGTGQSDSSYLTGLSAIEGTALKALASASGTAPTGTITAASPPPVTTTEHLPIVLIAKSGPSTVAAGTTEINPLSLNNTGGATASGLVITDSVPSGATGTVTGVPAALASGATASASAAFPVPTGQPPGNLTDTASVTWQDANGNNYGPVSSSFMTTVINNLIGASLTLAPAIAGPNFPGTSQTLTATLLDRNGHPISNQSVTFTVSGANPTTGTATTDANGSAVFTYVGLNQGNDVVQATVTAPGVTVTSNTSTISWGKLLQTAVTTQVTGNFFPNPSNSCTFDVGPANTPAFGQTFPDILFNPPPSAVPHDISTVNTNTRPFTDLTVDVNGNYNGQIVAQESGQQAGVGSLTNFYAQFNGSFNVNQPGDLTFTILHDDGYILGVGNGATRVNGDLLGNPATTPFNNYDVVAASNGANTGTPGTATVHFPAAGSYPYELDYTECGGGGLTLVLETAQFVAQTDPLSIYVGYADGLRAGGAAFPFPWQGSTGVTFVGGCTFDAGAIRFDNSGDTAITFDKVTVDLGAPPGAPHFDLWGPNPLVVPPHQILILTQTGCFNFDSSDFSNAGCGGNNNVQPLVNVTRGGITTTYTDTHQILNTRGFDLACQGNESTPWQRIAGSASTINVPLPPAASLNLTPFNVPGAVQGQSLTLTVSALDGAGNPASSLPISLQVFGANTQALSGTTGPNGLASFTYVGLSSGADSVQASASVGGLRAISNQGSVVWTAQGGAGTALAPSITSPSPADGSIVTKPTAISATFSPPAGDSIASWSVSYQGNGLPAVQLASGTGSPPTGSLATFDPTLLPNGAYTITISATSGGGALQTVSSSIAVLGNLKLGRYVITYQDLDVPVNGFRMQVLRTYDSYDKSAGDFGVGWRVSISNFRAQPNRVLGAGGWTQYNKQCGIGLCLTGFRNAAPRYVTVTWPDGHVEVFDFTPTGGTNIFWTGSAAYTARAGTNTTSTLQPVGDPSLSYTGDGNLYDGSGHPYDPQSFQLTSVDGKVIILSRQTGLVSIRDRNGNTLTVSAAGITSSNGSSIQFTRDVAGRITQILGPSGETFRYTYDGTGNLGQVVDANINATTFTYDSNHDLLKTTGPGGPLQTLTYDASGRLQTITDANNNTMSVTIDVGAQQTVAADPNHQLTTVLSYDGLGDLVEQDQIFGGQTLKSFYTYDAVGHVTSATDPLGHTKRMEYDSQGNLTAQVDATLNRSRLTYNSLGEVTSQIGPDGVTVVQLIYDTDGHLTEQRLNDLTKVDYTYDVAGHMASYTDATGLSQLFTYDAAGHLASATDKMGRQSFYTFNASGKVTQVIDPTGAPTKYTYDGMGNVSAVIDPRGGVQRFTYTPTGLILTATDGDGVTTKYAYDNSNELTLKTNRDLTTINYTYDADGHLATKTPTGGVTTTYSYDPLGHVTTMANGDGTIQYTYDAGGQVVGVTTGGTPTSPQPAVSLQYTYDPNGEVASITGPDGTTKYSYDSWHRLAQVTDPAGGLFRYTYDGLGRPTLMTRPNGVSDAYTYDPLGRPLSLDASLNGTVVNRAEYTYDALGHVTSFTDNSGQSTYQHDPLGNLVSATHPAASGVPNESYTYDQLGNRTAASTYDAANRLLSDGSFTYTYDANGDLTSRTGAGGTTRYTWNPERQLKSITYPDGTTSQFRYDPMGRRIEANDAGQIRRFVYDRADIHLIYDGTNTLNVSQVSSLRADDTLEYTHGGQHFYYLRDVQSTTRAITDASGATVAQFEYNSFGVPANTNPQAPWSTYTGREYESRSGLYFERARYYDPTIGRFISEDPLGATNLYHYAFGDPIDYSDPSGLGPIADYIKLLKFNAALGAILSALTNILFKQIPLLIACGHCDVADFVISVLAGAVGGALFGGAAGGLGWAGRSILGGVIGAEMAISAAIVEGNVTGKNPTGLQLAEAGLIGMAFGALGGLYSDPNLNAGYLLGGTTPIGAEGSFTRTATDGVFPFLFAQVPGDATSGAVGGFSCS